VYEAFYGFREKPFSILPDPDFLYLSPKHSMALALLEYGLMNQAGFNVITGEIGTGKTTLIRHLLGQLRSDVTVGLISNTHRSFGELLQWILYAFNLEGGRGMGKVEMFQRFVEFLVAQYSENRRTVLIIDEAQNMAPDTLEELRMLSNVNADKDQVLQVILVGQAELRDTLRRPDMRQFAQRIAVDYHLEALNRDESRTYIRHRIHVAGGTDKLLFDDGACDAVFDHSQGVPRLINLLCDTALVYAFADQQRRVDAQLVRDVARDKQQGGLFPSPEKKTLLNESEPHEEQLYPALLVEDPPLNGGERHATRTAIPIADADAVHDGPAPAQTNDVAALDLVILDYLKSRHAELYFKLKTVVDGLLKRRDERIP
jgi:general secretion pathway protein A